MVDEERELINHWLGGRSLFVPAPSAAGNRSRRRWIGTKINRETDRPDVSGASRTWRWRGRRQCSGLALARSDPLGHGDGDTLHKPWLWTRLR